MSGSDVSLIAVPGIPKVGPGDDVAQLIAHALSEKGTALAPYDVIVIASTIISKSEDRYFSLADVEPSERANELARVTSKDPRLVEMILRESIAVSRAAQNVLVVRHRLGFVSANAGIDFSNVDGPSEMGILLPVDPDESASSVRDYLETHSGIEPLAVVISDTHGRAFRKGNVNVAIGISGLPSIIDERGRKDLFGRVLEATVTPFADVVASAAGLVTGDADEGIPVVIVRGLQFDIAKDRASTLNWPPDSDLYA